MADKPKLTKQEFDKLFCCYVQQMSRQQHLPKQLEKRLLRPITEKSTL